jgi:heptosyltransferase-2
MPELRRILVRGVNWLGDAVMSTPALLRLREAHPLAHITLLTHAKLAEIWNGHPAVNAVETFGHLDPFWTVGRKLRVGNFEAALILPNSTRSAAEAWFARIPRRVGYAGNWRTFLLTDPVTRRVEAVKMHKRSLGEINHLIKARPPVSPAKLPLAAHHIFQYLHLATALGARPEPLAPYLHVSDAAVRAFAAKFGLATSPSNGPWLGLNTGAEYGPAKRWPMERFIDAASMIQQKLNCRWLIFGVASDAKACERIAGRLQQAAGVAVRGEPRALNLAGKTSLAELAAGLKSCRVLLTNDSGPMHVAGAVGTTVVVPFGSTSPELTGPGLPGDPRHQLLRANVSCSPCFLRECPIDFRCMTGITVEEVSAAVLRAVASAK